MSKFITSSAFIYLFPTIMVLIGFTVIYLVTTSGRSTSRLNLALNRVQLCILSKNANQRTQTDIEECYARIEAHMDTKIERDDR